jgi:hypothetical protein
MPIPHNKMINQIIYLENFPEHRDVLYFSRRREPTWVSLENSEQFGYLNSQLRAF